MNPATSRSAPDYHRLTVRSDGPAGHSVKVELDGRPLRCTRLEWSADVNSVTTVTITLPAVLLDVEADVVTSMMAPVHL